ncbi:glycosyl hydrolase [Parasediminibacterium sp. JCM 36343]|uniref:glycosyl hydrolase n=1 Tax=Parasediminibacterium sp. JCM 36343 TaxID=3374279 RepID=UPI00397AA511
MKKTLLTATFLFLIFPFLVFSQVANNTKWDRLEADFLNPPATAKPYVWWHWMGSNFSKQGITKDLEAMKAAGIGGATIFNLTSAVQEANAPTGNLPWPNQTYRSPAYWEAVRFAAAEAQRLGLEIGLHNSVGYSTTGGPWISEEKGMQKLIWKSIDVEGGKKISVTVPKPLLPVQSGYGSIGKVATYYHDIECLAVPQLDSFSLKQVINLTSLLDINGNITWEAPPGNWRIYRIGNCPTLKSPHPIPDDVIGKALEVDKMDSAYNAYHWHVVIDSIKQHLGKYMGTSFKHLLIDSYESGYQNWTSNFREEFIKRKGYDPLPWIVCFSKSITGEKDNKNRKIINSASETQRFDWDYTDVINRLYNEYGWQVGKKSCNENNLQLQWEPYSGPFDIVEGAGLPDLPMGEFWTSWKGGINAAIPAAARAAGKTIVGAESFTSWPINSKFTETPAWLKPSADGAFLSGVNRLVLHHWVHQPFDDKYQPGMGMGWWGTHFGRHQTWAEAGKAFFSYLGRCQVLLQFGEQVADYLCIDKQDGFSDLMATNDFLIKEIKVEGHQILLPSGRKYAFLVFPNSGTMLPAVAEKIKGLLSAGAYIVCTPPQSSPSLQGFPNADMKIESIAQEVWGNKTETNYGKGWVTNSVKRAIAKCNISPDFIVENAGNSKEIKFLHRQGANTHVFLIANTDSMPQKMALSFRVKGLEPEVWQAEDGSTFKASVWKEAGERTIVQLFLKASQTAFVVFRNPATTAIHTTSLAINGTATDCNLATKNNKPSFVAYKEVSAKVSLSDGSEKVFDIKPLETKEINGDWHVVFNPKLGTSFELNFPVLVDFSKYENKDVNYFSGTAHYTKQIQLTALELAKGKRVMLDLGTVNDIVQLHVNNNNMGVLWYPPYKKDITEALKVGANTLDIAVTNTWANRLIGDEQEPEDIVFGKERILKKDTVGRPLKEYPNWFINNTPRPSKGRKTFTNWYYYKKDSPLQPAGLVGPVRLQYGELKEL